MVRCAPLRAGSWRRAPRACPAQHALAASRARAVRSPPRCRPCPAPALPLPGNLVTVADFSQLSLQEGLATLLE